MDWPLQKPEYHFVPLSHFHVKEGTLVQDVMPFFSNGTYNLFYQCYPVYGQKRRAAEALACTTDLIRWRDTGIVLSPGDTGPDSGGCWTGCVVEDNGRFAFLYTGVSGQEYVNTQCLAFSRDLRTWTKYPGNPVIATPPEGIMPNRFRDPCVWKEGGTWHMAVGAGDEKETGKVLLYSSRDLIHWKYLRRLWEDGARMVGPMCECPDFFSLGTGYALITLGVESWKKTWYATGYLHRGRFVPETAGALDFGSFFAAKSLKDNAGRRILWGWISEEYGTSYMGFITAGTVSLPRLLSLDEKGTMRAQPVPELLALRDKAYQARAQGIEDGDETLFNGMEGACLEIEAEFEAPGSGECGLLLRSSPDGAECTRVLYSAQRKRIEILRSQSSLDKLGHRQTIGGELAIAPGEPLSFRVFLDNSVMEVFVNNRACMTARIYPSRRDSIHNGVYAKGGNVYLRTLRAWTMNPHGACVLP